MDLPELCPVCRADLASTGWPPSHERCPVTRADLEEWQRTGTGVVADLIRRREEDEIDELLLLLDDDDDL